MHYLLSLILFSMMAVAQVEVPALTSPVMDEAGLLSATERDDLAQFAYEINTHQGPQITILTVNDMQGNEIEEFSIRVAEKWQLGTKDRGNGLLIVIAKQERKMRIEVGQGIEGEITDYESNMFIRNILQPAFRQNQFHAGLRLVMEEVAKRFNIQTNQPRRYVRRATPARVLSGPMVAAFPILLILIIIGHLIFRNKPAARGVFTGTGLAGTGFFLGGLALPVIGVLFLAGILVGMIGLHNILYAMMTSGGRGFSRGGGGGFGGGGGGWSGGGGGFSGGGSSGSW